jgi:hypothetical protein
MSQSEHKRQKAVMKKRSKEKAAAKQRVAQPRAAGGPTFIQQTLMRQARAFPILGCWISANWEGNGESLGDDGGLVQVLIAREQPNGEVCVGSYLIDKWCLGLKNTLAKLNIPRSTYMREVPDTFFREQKAVKCSPELAHQMIYAAIEYAAQFGFTPQKDFAYTQYILAPRGEFPEAYDLTFGKDGKPFFVAGPYDDVGAVMRQLERTAGSGNYHYFAPISPDFAF